MNLNQIHRLETAAKLIGELKGEVARIDEMREWIKESTSLKFWNKGNCEHGVLIGDGQDEKLFEAIKEATDIALARQRNQCKDRIDGFSASYVEKGD